MIIEKSKHPKKRVLSLFSGCGGMDLGFEGGFEVHHRSVADADDILHKNTDNKAFVSLKKTGFETVFANDIVPATKIVWEEHFRQHRGDSSCFVLGSIVDLVRSHQQGHSVFPDGIDVVTGGFPCQDFSLAGKRQGFFSHKNHLGEVAGWDDARIETRGKLYMWMKEVIDITRPKIFIAENVKGLVNLSNVKDISRSDFAGSDQNGYYIFEPRVLQAADFGVPQSRERVIFIGVRKSALKPEILSKLENKCLNGSLDPYPRPTHAFSQKTTGLRPPVTCGDVLSHLREPESSSDPAQKHYSKAKFMGMHCQGQREIDWNGVAPTIRSEHHGNIEFRRLSPENGGTNREKNPHEKFAERRLTPRECGLLQTFPPDFPLVLTGKVSPSAAYKMIGNAVPPLLAYHLAKQIDKIWDHYF